MDNCQVINEECPSEDRREDFRQKNPATFDHIYDHTMAVILTQLPVNKGLKLFGDIAIDAVTKEFTQLEKLGVLIPKCFSDLSGE